MYVRFVKPAVDLVLALVATALLAPFALGVALTILAVEGGPVLFSQTRIGKRGRPFPIYKFRTMLPGSEDEHGVTARGDTRITRLGAFLRRWKLDELPQLYNVLRGQMSLVGPRPEVPGYADTLSGEDRLILEIRPGITGPATLTYRNEEEILAAQPDPVRYNDEVIFPDKFRINLCFLREVSLSKDLGYLLKTVIG